jgi:uncharacterized protein (TIRG00374 family)
MKLDWKGMLGIIVSVALLAWTLRDESPAAVWAVIQASDVSMLALMIVLATLPFPIRAIRWAVILEPVAKVPFGPLWRSTAIGMMANNVLPARAGEFARAYCVSLETPKVSFAAALGSLVVDRVMDAVAVLILLFASLLISEFPETATVFGFPLERLARIAALATMVPLAGVALVAFRPAMFENLASTVLRRVTPRLHDRLMSLVRSIIAGLGSLRSPVRFAKILGLALLGWVLMGISFWLGFRAVGIDAPLASAFFLQGLIAFAVAIPSSPGFFGVFEYFGKEGLRLYGVPGELAISWALSYHILTFLPITLFGMYYFARMGLHLSDFQKRKPSPT